MRTLFRLSLLSVICLFAIIGCHSKVKAHIDGNVLVIDADSTQSYNIHMSIGGVSFATSLRGREKFNYMDSLKNRKDAHYELAYSLAQNKGIIDAHLSIPSKLDTIIPCKINHNNIEQHHGELQGGKFAKIVNSFESDKIDSKLRRWVYINKKANLGDTLFNDMKLYLRDLSTNNIKYIVTETIPSFKKDDFKSYTIISDMVAEYYYLNASNNDEMLDSFIEVMICENLSAAAKSLEEPLKCYRQRDTWGAQCLFLVGINKDWSSQVQPLGVISIDNIAPSYGLYQYSKDESYTTLNFSKRGFIIDVTEHPKVEGRWKVESGDFEGWNPYRVPWTFTWSGDVSKIVLHKSKTSTETINLKGKTSPYHMTILTYLPNLGDNYVKVEAYDSVGNKAETDINISLERIIDNNPQINIDNNIWN